MHETFDSDNKTFIKHPTNADFETKLYLFFDLTHLFKNIRNKPLNQNKFVHRYFNLICFMTQSMFQTVTYDGVYFVKCLKETKIFRLILENVTHLGNNKQSVSLTLEIFQESITAAIKSYFPNRLDAANFLTLFYKVFVICNSK